MRGRIRAPTWKSRMPALVRKAIRLFRARKPCERPRAIGTSEQAVLD